MGKKFIMLLLTVVIVFGALTFTASAAGSEVLASGTCGELLNWEFTSDGNLHIYGVGEMDSWRTGSAPWEDDYGQDITSVTIDTGVASIGYSAFSSCPNLERVTMPNTISFIDGYAFAFCEKLTEITIPASVNTIGEGAFCWCTSLTNVTIPNGVFSIGENAFSDCTGLTSFVIPSNVTTINKQTFYNCSGLTSVSIHNNVTAIGEEAFYGCKNLSSITIPSSVTTLGKGVFDSCYKLTSITIPEGITTIETFLFFNCIGLTDVTLPSTVTTIGDYAFQNCSGLTKIVIPENVTTISWGAFTECRNLTDIAIPESLVLIRATAFDGCYKLADVYYGGTEAQWNAIENNDTLTDATIHFNTTQIPVKNPFTDVPAGSYYSDAVLWAIGNGITNGTSENTFGPEGTCLRAQVVAFLYRAAGSPEPTSSDNPFTDVPADAYYSDAVLWAIAKKITNGTSATTFGSFDNCNRAAVVTFLWRAAGSPEPETHSNPFVDVKATDFYYKAVLWAVENNITNGVDATHFGPTQSCNRAQVVTFLYRASK